MSPANLNNIKIEAHHCYRCGGLFSAKGKKKTMHHSIPQFLKPERNILIPICENCHKEMNKYNVQSFPKFEAMENLIKNLKSAIAKWEKALGKEGGK